LDGVIRIVGSVFLFFLIAGLIVKVFVGIYDFPNGAGGTPVRGTNAVSAGTIPDSAATWANVRTWRGSGIKQTESFVISSRKWRISWSTGNEPSPDVGVLQVFVFNEAGDVVSLAGNKRGPGSDVSYVYGTPGEYHLMINSANIDWTVEVEEPR